MTLLSICQQVARETGFSAPSSIVGSTNDTAVKLLAAAQTSGRTLATGRIYNARGTFTGTHNWTALTKEQTFTTNGTSSYALTAAGIITDGDFMRFANNTWWDRTNDRPLEVVDNMTWQQYVSGVVTLGINKIIKKRGTNIVVYPTEASGETWAFEYVSNKWCESSGGTAQSSWLADTDLPLLDEELHILDIKWRFEEMLGIPFAAHQSEFYEEMIARMGEDGGRNMIDISRPKVWDNIPETGYGL